MTYIVGYPVQYWNAQLDRSLPFMDCECTGVNLRYEYSL